MQEQERITMATFVGLMALALALDAVYIAVFFMNFIPVMGMVIAIPTALWLSLNATTIFTGIFLLLGTTFVSYRFMIRLMVVILAKFMPIVSAIPMWTLYVFLTCRETRKEDKEHNELVRKQRNEVIKTLNRFAEQDAQDEERTRQMIAKQNRSIANDNMRRIQGIQQPA